MGPCDIDFLTKGHILPSLFSPLLRRLHSVFHSSHYVAFVKAGGRKGFARMQEMLASLDPELAYEYGNGLAHHMRDGDDDHRKGHWLFFDSMAGRVGLQNGYNVPEVIHVNDFEEWVRFCCVL